MEPAASPARTPEASAPPPAATPEEAEYIFGPFRLDVPSLQLWRGDQNISLTPKAFDTLLVLLQHRNRLVRKEELLSAVWPNSFVSEDSLAQNITALRRSLGDDPAHPQYIATVPRRGYRFIAPVTAHAAGEEAASRVAGHPFPATAASADTGRSVFHTAPVRRRISFTAVVVIAAACVAAFLAGRGTAPSPQDGLPTLSVTMEAPAGTRLASGGVLSPDGRSLAIVAQDESTGALRIWVRALDTGVARMIEGSEGASRPFWSPDGKALGFFANGLLKRIAVDGGAAQTLASFVGLTSSGGSWSVNDTILFASYKTGLWGVPAAGGPPKEITKLDADALETAHRWPQFLPDGRRFLFSVVAETPGHSGVYLGALDSPDRVKLLDENAAVYAPPGHLLFTRDRVLMAQSFDAESGTLTGTPVAVAGNVAAPNANNNATISAGRDLLTFGNTSDLRLVWFDRTGRALEDVRSPAGLSNPTLSADQSHVVAGNGTDIWLIDLERDAPTRIVPGNTPLQSPDGSHIAYTSAKETGYSDIFVRATSGPGHDDLLVRTAENKFVNDWSRDDRYVVYGSLNPQTRMDLWIVPRHGERKPVPFLATPFNEFQAQVSPDSRWIAYASDESGIWEVYLQSFPVPDAKRAISAGGGSEPQWRGDGRELFYLAADGTLMSVDVQTGGTPQVGRPRPLFRTPIPISGEMYSRRNHYVPSRDGQRFLLNAPESPQGSVTMVVNWRAALAQ